MTEEILYRVYFMGLKYPQPCWEVFKFYGITPLAKYVVGNKSCQCEGWERYRRCKHILLRDFFEANNRPECFLRVSGGIHIFIVEREFNQDT